MRKTKRSIPYLEQSENSECGLCSLAMILSYYNCNYSINELREKYPVGRDGLNLLIIKAILESKYFMATAFRINSISDIKFPSILHANHSHFVVAEKRTKNGIKIVDPQVGKYEMTLEDINNCNIILGLHITATPNSERRKKINPPKTNYLKNNYILFMICSLLLTLILQFITISIPIVVKYFIDNMSVFLERYELQTVFVVCTIIAIAYLMINVLSKKIAIILQVKINSDISQRFVKKILSLPYRFFINRGTGDIIHRYTGAVVIREMISKKILLIWLDIGMIIAYLFYMTTISINYFFFMVFLAIIMLSIAIPSFKKNSELQAKEIVGEAKTTTYLNEILQAINLVKMKGIEDYTYLKWHELFSYQMKTMKEKGGYLAYTNSIISTIQFIAPLILLGFSATEVVRGGLTIGTVFSIYIVSQGFFSPITSFTNTINEILFGYSYYKRIAEIHIMSSEEKDINKITDIQLDGSIFIKNLSFSYNIHGKEVLKNINLSIKPGEFIGIIGETGSGKTTLATILMGLERATIGNIYYNDTDMNTIDKKVLRRQIGVVGQENYFFKQNIKSNIIFGSEGVTESDIIQACKDAAIWEDVEKMPMQLETILSENASNISGGQKQRLALARAVINNPKVLIMDEGSSALDNITEKKIQKTLQNMQCTRIIIAHRLSTIINADKIIILEDGEITDIGKHYQLINKNNYYKKLYEKYLVLN